MKDSPVTKEDVAFARAVVALAREHQMGELELSFRQNFSLGGRTHSYSQKRVRWHEGRHGAEDRIAFKLDAEASFTEKEQVEERKP